MMALMLTILGIHDGSDVDTYDFDLMALMLTILLVLMLTIFLVLIMFTVPLMRIDMDLM